MGDTYITVNRGNRDGFGQLESQDSSQDVRELLNVGLYEERQDGGGFEVERLFKLKSVESCQSKLGVRIAFNEYVVRSFLS